MIELYDIWQKPVRIASNGVVDEPGKTVDQVRGEIASRVENQLALGYNGMLIISAPAGVGKSYTTKEKAEYVSGRYHTDSISWFMPRHNGYASLDRDDEWTQIYGRYGDKTKQGEVILEGNCDHDDYCRHCLQKGYSGALIVCSPKDESKRKPNVWKCSIPRENCKYWQQFETDSHWFLTAEFIGACKLWSATNGIVVLDEIDTTDLLPEPVEITPLTICAWIKKYPMVAKRLEKIRSIIIDDSISDDVLYEAFLSVLDSRDLDLLMGATKTMPDVTYDVSNSDEIEKLPDSRCKEFLQTILTELSAYRKNEPVVSRIVAHPDCYKFYPKLDLSKKFVDLRNEYKSILELPSVLLNATADVAGLKNLLASEDYKIDVYSPHVDLHPDTTIAYDISRNNSKYSVNGRESYRNRWLGQIRDYVGQTKTLVVATMVGEDLIISGLSDLIESGLIEIAHYGNVSGLNKFEDCQQVILAQPFQPSPVAVAERYRQIYGGSIGAPLDLATCYREARIDTGNDAYNVFVRTMKDDRLRPIYENWRNAEHYQAAHRVRPVLHKRKVIVLFAIPIDGLQATEIIYTESKSGRKQKMNDLEDAATELLDTQGYFTQADLKKSGFSHKFVINNWNKLREELGLDETKALVKGKRYKHKGQMVKALTNESEEDYKVGDWVIYNFVSYDTASWDTIGTRQMNGQVTGKPIKKDTGELITDWFYIDHKLVPKPCIVSKAYYAN